MLVSHEVGLWLWAPFITLFGDYLEASRVLFVGVMIKDEIYNEDTRKSIYTADT